MKNSRLTGRNYDRRDGFAESSAWSRSAKKTFSSDWYGTSRLLASRSNSAIIPSGRRMEIVRSLEKRGFVRLAARQRRDISFENDRNN